MFEIMLIILMVNSIILIILSKAEGYSGLWPFCILQIIGLLALFYIHVRTRKGKKERLQTKIEHLKRENQHLREFLKKLEEKDKTEG